jgi:hypothetical protein
MMIKAFMRKQFRLIAMVAMMVLMLLLSTQVLMTHHFKHETMVERVLSTNSPQIMIHVHERDFIPYIEHIIEQYNQQIDSSTKMIHVESTMMFNVTKNNFGLFFEVLSPTLRETLPLVEGQSLNELQWDEAAIIQSYANELRQQGIDPFQEVLTLDTIDGIKEFKVVSIVDYPNFNDPYIPDNGLKSIPLFDFPYPSAALVLEDQLKEVQLVEESSTFFGQVSTRIKFAPGVSHVFHLRFDTYSIENERELMDYLYRNLGFYPDGITFYPIYEYSDYLSTHEQLYAMVTRYGLIALSLLSALGLVVLLRQQFLQNIKPLGLLVTLGHSYARVTMILLSRFLVALLVGLLSWFLINGLISPLLQNQRELSKILDQTTLILAVSAALVSITFIIWISISGYLSVRSLRYAHTSLNHQKKNTIHLFPIKKHWKIPVAIKGLLSRFSFTTSMIILMALIIAGVTSFALISHQVSNIYNEETLGVQFDYIVLDAPFKHYEITETIADTQVWVQKYSNYLFVDVHYSKNYFNYYKSSVLFFMANMEGYVTPIEGTLPTDLRNNFREWKYDIRESMASRKQMEKTNSFVYSVEMVQSTRSAERGYLFISTINPNQSNRETAAQIKGTMNTLIDQGWIAYVYRDYLMVEVNVPYMEMYLFNLSDDISQQTAEALMDEQGIQYMSFNEITDILNRVNRVTQRQVFSFISLTIGLMISLLMLVLGIYFKTMKLEQASNHQLLSQLGISKNTLKQMKIIQVGFIWISGLLLASWMMPVLFNRMHDEMLQAYGLYTTLALPSWTLWSVFMMCITSLLTTMILYHFSHCTH